MVGRDIRALYRAALTPAELVVTTFSFVSPQSHWKVNASVWLPSLKRKKQQAALVFLSGTLF